MLSTVLALFGFWILDCRINLRFLWCHWIECPTNLNWWPEMNPTVPVWKWKAKSDVRQKMFEGAVHPSRSLYPQGEFSQQIGLKNGLQPWFHCSLMVHQNYHNFEHRTNCATVPLVPGQLSCHTHRLPTAPLALTFYPRRGLRLEDGWSGEARCLGAVKKACFSLPSILIRKGSTNLRR